MDNFRLMYPNIKADEALERMKHLGMQRADIIKFKEKYQICNKHIDAFIRDITDEIEWYIINYHYFKRRT